jgi:predicted nucleotidyltransferase
MRLTSPEVTGMIKGISVFLLGQKAELKLYGSRVNDNLKGGDIDLLLIVTDEKTKITLLKQKPEILVSIKNYLGEQRIDLKIATTAELRSDPFLQIIAPQAITLHSF